MAMEVISPMAGKIISIQVKVGDFVNEGDEFAILEAMKMELPIVSPISGMVKQIKVKPGQGVEAGEVLGIIEP